MVEKAEIVDFVDSPDPDMVRDCQYYRGMTNADRIRSMTDEELAGYLSHIDSPYRMGYARKDERGWLDWLKQEYFDNKIGEPITIKPGDVQLSDKVFPDGLI